jgi:hypothetical protein
MAPGTLLCRDFWASEAMNGIWRREAAAIWKSVETGQLEGAEAIGRGVGAFAMVTSPNESVDDVSSAQCSLRVPVS